MKNTKDLEKLISDGQKLFNVEYKIKKKRFWNKHSFKRNKYENEYRIAAPADDFFKWTRECREFFGSKYGYYSRELKGLDRVMSRTEYRRFLNLLRQSVTISIADYSLAREEVKFMKEMGKQYVQDILDFLEKYYDKILDLKSTYKLENIDRVFDIVLKQKNISKELTSKLCGNLVAQGIVIKLWAICKRENIYHKPDKVGEDDIKLLSTRLQKSKNLKISKFFSQNCTKFSRAERVRNQSCHANEKAATINELKVLLETWRSIDLL